jgi:hypothetical protein
MKAPKAKSLTTTSLAEGVIGCCLSLGWGLLAEGCFCHCLTLVFLILMIKTAKIALPPV